MGKNVIFITLGFPDIKYKYLARKLFCFEYHNQIKRKVTPKITPQ